MNAPDPTKYNFSYSSDLIATAPATPRESARMLVYHKNTDTVIEDTFAHIGSHLPKGTVLVLNNTKVVPARIPAKKKTGGIIYLLWLAHTGKTEFTALSPKRLEPGDTLTFGKITIIVHHKEGSTYTCTHTGTQAHFMRTLSAHGTTPTPPYIKNITMSEQLLRKRYQTTFAKHAGSVAAPTASLHFSKPLLARLKKQGIEIRYVTLHVGLGTFAPLTDKELSSGMLHEERYSMPETTYRALVRARSEGRLIIPVGTTALRTIESVWASPTHERSGATRLFIYEGYSFRIASGLVTNFHVPQSSLLMLVAALVGRVRLLELYEYAKKKRFRFFSFGDGMLVLP
jgi:S-adenosylmethionine:tRNA ribosyltransferase-isomerase